MKVLCFMLLMMVVPMSMAEHFTVIKPVSIRIANDDQMRVSLSNQEVNRLFVVHDKIINLNFPQGRLSAHHDQSGSVFTYVTGKTPFTLFITTEKGRHFSLFVVPKSEPGLTVRLIARSPAAIAHSTHRLKPLAIASTYEQTLVDLLHDAMLGKTPPGYSAITGSSFRTIRGFQIPARLNGQRNLSEHIVEGYLGGSLAIRVLQVSNIGRTTVTLMASEFYRPGLRAVAIAREQLAPKKSTRIYEVISNV